MSPYASALAYRLKEEDDIRNILGKVADDVSAKYEQYPIYRANLKSNVCLNGKCKDYPIIEKVVYLDENKELNRLREENKLLKDTKHFTEITTDYLDNFPKVVSIGALDWQDVPDNKTKKINFDEARGYCQNLKTDNYNWRLPQKNELDNLVKNQNKLHYVVKDTYWSSTNFRSNSYIHFVVQFDMNKYNPNTSTARMKQSTHYVRCIKSDKIKIKSNTGKNNPYTYTIYGED